MIAATENMSAALGRVFTIYAIFWVTVIVVLLIAVGFLLKKRERLLKRNQEHGTHGSH